MRTATVTNPGTSPVIVNLGGIVGAAAQDFTFMSSTGSNGPITLNPGDSFTVRFEARPTAVGARIGTFDILLCDGGCPGLLGLSAEGIVEAVTCGPPSVSFGLIPPNTCATQVYTCANDSDQHEQVASYQFTPASSPAFTVRSPAAPLFIAPRTSHTFEFDYCPTGFTSDNGVFVATVVHPDPVRSTKTVTVNGQGGGQDIDCAPTTIDFGLVTSGQRHVRSVTCTNRGNIPLLVSNAALAAGAPAELSIESTINGAPVSFPTTVSAQDAIDVSVIYEPTAAGMVASSVTVSSNDADEPMITVPITGTAVMASGCTLTTNTTSLDFGVVSPNTIVDREVTFSNTGTGDCVISLQSIMQSPPFTAPGTTTTTLPVGQNFVLGIRFAPTGTGAYQTVAAIQTNDPNRQLILINLAGTSRVVDTFFVQRDAIDFGQVATGCTNPVIRNITLRNIGPSAVSVTSVAMASGSAASFSVAAANPMYMLATGDTVTVPIAFEPTAIGTLNGSVEITATGLPTFTVDVTGAGAAAPTNVQMFPGAPSSVVDVLLVVDDSCSMTEEQALMAAASQVLIERGDRAGADYHVGVITTDADVGNNGVLRGTPSFVNSADPNRAAILAQSIMLGVSGSATEQGLLTAQTAVTDATLLAGTNAGFLRANGELSVIVLSDEDDQSPGDVFNYLEAMRNRPTGLTGSLTVSVITGGATSCTGAGGNASRAPRYLAAAGLTGGEDALICGDSFTEVMQRVSDSAFGALRDRFQLGAQPAPGTIEVQLDGVVLPVVTGTVANYYVDYENAAVVFPPGRGPTRTADVQISYTAFCVAGTCGDAMPQAGEECDDGNMDNTDACPDTCWDAFCGDGYVQANVEGCDDMNTVPGDGCNQTCTIEGCGNGIPEPGEECDLGMMNSDTAVDGCRTDCRNAYCHDGVQDTGEMCDDGNTLDTDACVDECVPARCGDGHTQLGTEQCDDGNMVDTDDCNNMCVWTVSAFTVTSTPNITLTPTAGGTPLTFSSPDDGFATVPIGFPFEFMGRPVTTVYPSTNGLLAFETGGATAYSNVGIPNVQAPNAFIAWWWDDLHSTRIPTATFTQTSTGTTPNRELVLTFQNVPQFSAGTVLLNVEIRLHETTNVITVHYGQLGTVGGTTRPHNASVGWESWSGTRGADVLGCAPSCATAVWPADTLFTYTP